MKWFSLLILLGGSTLGWAQGPYAPPAGQPGSTAIHRDSSIFVGWAQQVQVVRGWQNRGDTSLGKVTHGQAADAVGKANGQVVSLGDSGHATASFVEPLYDGPGFDFAIFENGITDDFLELAFVEVSSDGQHFVRFPAVSLTPDTAQTGPFGSTDATMLYNLAGKYRSGFGTPFDLHDLRDSSGVDLQNITHVRVVDVIGALGQSFTTFDSQGHPVNDPYPTAFASGGFDLDAIGVIHAGSMALEESRMSYGLYPNPAREHLILAGPGGATVHIYSGQGRLVWQGKLPHQGNLSLSTSQWVPGVYFLHWNGSAQRQKLLIRP